jgi:hypothetical protein
VIVQKKHINKYITGQPDNCIKIKITACVSNDQTSGVDGWHAEYFIINLKYISEKRAKRKGESHAEKK